MHDFMIIYKKQFDLSLNRECYNSGEFPDTKEKEMKRILLLSLATLIFCLCIFTPITANALNITTGEITGSDVAMHKEADIDSKVLCKLDKGTLVKILKTNVNAEWYKVEYNGKTGYVNRTYISWDISLDEYNLKYTGKVVNCKKNINIRSKPSTSSDILDTADKGAQLTVTKKIYSKGWSQVTIDGKTGYVSSSYLEITPVVDDTKLSSLSVSGGSLSPAFSPYEYGYVVLATSSKVTVSVKANSGVKINVNGTGKSSASVSLTSGAMKTVRIALNGKVTYSVYISRNVITYGTWNIKRGYGNLLMQGRLIYDQQPDIMGIQEASQNNSSSNIVDNLASLRTKTMKYMYFSPTINYTSGAKYGIGILSRYKMSGLKTYKLDSGGYEGRILIKAVVTINGKKVSIYNTHFTYQTAKVRATQFAQVISIMNKDTNKYKILTGDFNASEAEFSPFSKYTVAVTSAEKYYDYSGTLINNAFLDNIIVTKNIKVINSRIITVSLSDHYPVFAYLVLK
jgi:endonuclease/exonuclease/phosphatase family metal-dependent hydrolase/uncharacterized protein YgiM (DUF1202 family)